MNHDDVAGIGVCVACRKVVCEGCTTRLQGRNFCADCLAMRGPPTPATGVGGSTLSRAAVGALSLASVGVMAAAVTGIGFLLYLAG